jgi:hypothetical protein
MGEGSVTKPIKGRPSWKLKPPHDRWTQGMVVSGFSGLPRSDALFLFFDWPANEGGGGRKGAWLQTLNAVAPITGADGKEPRAAAIAFT